MKPKIAFIYDTEGWAFHNKSRNIKKYLDNFYEISILRYDTISNIEYDAIITFSPNCLPKHIKNKKRNFICGISSKKKLSDFKKLLDYTHVHTNDKESFDMIRNKNKYLILNGVDTDLFSFEEKKLDVNKPLKIGMVGSKKYLEHKGYYRLQEICNNPLIKDKVINMSYFIDTKNEKEKIKSQSEMKDYYDDIDLFIVSSFHENTPNPLLEAMSSGVPVISNNTGMAKDLIKHGNNGFIIESYSDIDSYVKYINILLNDEKLYNQFSILGRKQVEKFNWSSISFKYKDMIDDFLKRKQTNISIILTCHSDSNYESMYNTCVDYAGDNNVYLLFKNKYTEIDKRIVELSETINSDWIFVIDNEHIFIKEDIDNMINWTLAIKNDNMIVVYNTGTDDIFFNTKKTNYKLYYQPNLKKCLTLLNKKSNTDLVSYQKQFSHIYEYEKYTLNNKNYFNYFNKAYNYTLDDYDSITKLIEQWVKLSRNNKNCLFCIEGYKTCLKYKKKKISREKMIEEFQTIYDYYSRKNNLLDNDKK
jgi:glycosyltransferase involved in cell wall biosynthesis